MPRQWTPGHVHRWIRLFGKEVEECESCHRQRRTIYGELKHFGVEFYCLYIEAMEAMKGKNAEIAELRAGIDDEQQNRGEAIEDNARLTGENEGLSAEVKRIVKLMRIVRTSAWSAWSRWPGKDDSEDIKRIMEITSEFKDESTEKNAKNGQEERV